MPIRDNRTYKRKYGDLIITVKVNGKSQRYMLTHLGFGTQYTTGIYGISPTIAGLKIL